MKVVISPFWALQTKKQQGLYLGFTMTRFDYLASGSFRVIEIDLILLRLRITF